METIFSPDFWWLAPAITAATVVIAGFINGLFKIEKNIWRQVVAWVVASGLTVGSYFLHMIEFGYPQWVSIVCMAVVTSLSSGGLYDIPTIKKFIEAIEAWLKTKPSIQDKQKDIFLNKKLLGINLFNNFFI